MRLELAVEIDPQKLAELDQAVAEIAAALPPQHWEGLVALSLEIHRQAAVVTPELVARLEANRAAIVPAKLVL